MNLNPHTQNNLRDYFKLSILNIYFIKVSKYNNKIMALQNTYLYFFNLTKNIFIYNNAFIFEKYFHIYSLQINYIFINS